MPQRVFVERDSVTGLFVIDEAVLHSILHRLLQFIDQFATLVLDISKDFADGITFDNGLNLGDTIVNINMYRMCVAKKIVQVAKDFLIGTHHEHRQLVGFVGTKFMK